MPQIFDFISSKIKIPLKTIFLTTYKLYKFIFPIEVIQCQIQERNRQIKENMYLSISYPLSTIKPHAPSAATCTTKPMGRCSHVRNIQSASTVSNKSSGKQSIINPAFLCVLCVAERFPSLSKSIKSTLSSSNYFKLWKLKVKNSF